jgi:hypothetical protein
LQHNQIIEPIPEITHGQAPEHQGQLQQQPIDINQPREQPQQPIPEPIIARTANQDRPVQTIRNQTGGRYNLRPRIQRPIRYGYDE